MGVPLLYRWLTQRYPEIKRPISTRSKFYTDNLYLDFNAIIHPCCDKELGTLEHTESQLYANLVCYVDKLMSIIRPQRMLYIAIDGVAPRAKLNQQRGRRFIKAKESLLKGEEYFDDEHLAEAKEFSEDTYGEDLDGTTDSGRSKAFDSNALTPGTKFMSRLDAFIQELIKCKLSDDPLWSGLNVIFSGFRIPGEGEQKIMEYIRKHQSPRARHVIYSPDADLIFLGLTLYDYNVFIMREEPKRSFAVDSAEALARPKVLTENTYDDKDFVLVDIQKLKGFLIDEFSAQIKQGFDPKNFIHDWVFLCFSVGNDFVPCVPCLEIKTNAIEKITVILIANFRNTGRYITNGRGVDFVALKSFFGLLAERENDFLVEKNRNLLLSRTRMNLPYDPEAEFAMNTEVGKIRFYIEKMGIESEEALLVACKEYIKGMVWIYNYYFYEVPSWEWFYPYHYAPFMADLARVSNVGVSFNLSRPMRPLEQLLTVLPPLSKNLLPVCLHDVFKINEKEYPEDFKVDTFQKCMEWQAVPILPFIDVNVVKKLYAERHPMLSAEETERNNISYPVMFSNRPNLVKKAAVMEQAGKNCGVIACSEYCGRVYPLENATKIDESVQAYLFSYVNQAVAFSFDQRTRIQPPPQPKRSHKD